MKVEIFSIMAAFAGKESGTTWRGDVPIGFNGHYISTADNIFRFFNVVDEEDSERLEKLGYRLPSLSVGDYFTVHFPEIAEHGPTERPRTYRVLGNGFEEITGNQNAIMEAFK
jgi:hypothetical protein